MSWELVARKKSEEKYLYRRIGTNIFEVRSVRGEDQLFRVGNPDHELFEPIAVDFHQMNEQAVRAIRNNQTEAYDELDIEEGFAVVGEEEIQFESSTESKDLLANLV
mgnify:CR=1 FL=1